MKERKRAVRCREKVLGGLCCLKKIWRIWVLFMLGLFAFLIPQAKASEEEMYILLNMLVEKGYITSEESKEVFSAIRNISEKNKKDLEKNSVKTGGAEKLTVGGYLQTRYDAYDYSGTKDQFRIKSAKISLSGKIIEHSSFKIELDATKGKNNDLLSDAWIKLTYLPKANITFGQFKIPYSEEYSISSSAIDTIERSLPINKMASEYDIGVMVDGHLFNKNLYYGVGLVNGTGGNKSEDNDDKDIVGRVIFTPWANYENIMSGLSFGAGYQSGKQNTGTNETDRTRTALMLKYQIKNFKIYGEYLTQELETTSTIKSDGWYVLCAYNHPLANDRSIQPVLKYEVYDPDTDISNNSQAIFTAGINFMLNKMTRLSTNYRWRTDEQRGKIATNMNEWFSQIQVKF